MNELNTYKNPAVESASQICPNCGKTNRMNSLFCNRCGASLIIENKNTILCSDCGTENDDDAVFCDHCGTPLIDEPKTPDEKIIVVCPEAKFEKNDNGRFCKYCAFPLTKSTEAIPDNYDGQKESDALNKPRNPQKTTLVGGLLFLAFAVAFATVMFFIRVGNNPKPIADNEVYSETTELFDSLSSNSKNGSAELGHNLYSSKSLIQAFNMELVEGYDDWYINKDGGFTINDSPTGVVNGECDFTVDVNSTGYSVLGFQLYDSAQSVIDFAEENNLKYYCGDAEFDGFPCWIEVYVENLEAYPQLLGRLQLTFDSDRWKPNAYVKSLICDVYFDENRWNVARGIH